MQLSSSSSPTSDALIIHRPRKLTQSTENRSGSAPLLYSFVRLSVIEHGTTSADSLNRRIRRLFKSMWIRRVIVNKSFLISLLLAKKVLILPMPTQNMLHRIWMNLEVKSEAELKEERSRTSVKFHRTTVFKTTRNFVRESAADRGVEGRLATFTISSSKQDDFYLFRRGSRCRTFCRWLFQSGRFLNRRQISAHRKYNRPKQTSRAGR